MRFLVAALLLSSCASTHAPASVIWPKQTDVVQLDILGNEAPVQVSVIHLDSPITHETEVEFEMALAFAATHGTQALVIDIDSLGGNVQAANHIAFDIIEQPIPVVCVVQKLAASAAFLIFQLCPARIIEPEATLMLHEASMPIEVDSLFDYLEGLIGMQALNDRLQLAMCGRMTITEKQCANHYRGGGEWWMGANEALKVGAADVIWTEAKVIEFLQFPSIE